MKISDAIEQLKSLQNHCKSMQDSDADIWVADVEALSCGIFAMEIVKGQGHDTMEFSSTKEKQI